MGFRHRQEIRRDVGYEAEADGPDAAKLRLLRAGPEHSAQIAAGVDA